MSTPPQRSPDLQNAGDLKFSLEVYPDKRLRLPKFQDGQLPGPYFAKYSAIYRKTISQDLKVLDT